MADGARCVLYDRQRQQRAARNITHTHIHTHAPAHVGVSACASTPQVYKLPTLFFVGTNGASKPAAHYTGLLPEHVMRDMVETRSQFLGTDIHKALNI